MDLKTPPRPAPCRFSRRADNRFTKQLKEKAMDKAVFERGMEIRKSVLGKEFVEKSFAAADDFNRPMQELVTEYCWGAVWGREELPKKIRSMLNLAMISALNRPHELKMHVKGALRNGVSREEIREVLLQVAIYCGVPAAVDSFRIAREAFTEIDKEV
jgi:4-carboxymuconolactone decarboxylase